MCWVDVIQHFFAQMLFKQRLPKDINKVIELHREALVLHTSPDLARISSLNKLAKGLQMRFEQCGDLDDINEAIIFYREVLALHAPPHHAHEMSLTNLANAVKARFEQHRDSKDIDEVIELQREVLALFPPLHPDRHVPLNKLGHLVWNRFEEQGDLKDLDGAIDLYREVLILDGPLHPTRIVALNNLGTMVQMRFAQQGNSKDIAEAIKLHTEALALCIPPHPNHGDSLNNLAVAIKTRFTESGDSNDIEEAIQLHREALALRAPPHPARGSSLNNLAVAILERFDHWGDLRDIDDVIQLHREALALHSSLHQDQGGSLNNLVNVLHKRFEQHGDVKDMDEAIELGRKALALHAQPHPQRGNSLNNLAIAIHARFEQQGNLDDIKEAIQLHREALTLHALPHPCHEISVNNLAGALQTRFELQGDIKDINEAIQLHREALASHPGVDSSINNLAAALQIRFVQQGNLKDINEAIELLKEALVPCIPPHLDRSMGLNNLGVAMYTRFKLRGESEDIEKSIELHREALALNAPPHSRHDMSLNNLACALQARFEQLRDAIDLNEAIEINRKALAVRAPPHPDCSSSLNNLAMALKMRFDQWGDFKDLDEVLELHRDALALRAPPHPDRGVSLHNLGACLADAYMHSKDGHNLDGACALFQEAATYLSSSPFNRFYHARLWALTATQYNHTSALDAYKTAIELLPQLAALHLDLPSRLEILSTAKSNNLASEAAACAVSLDQYDTAVEFLEASRSVFWSQSLHLRTPMDVLASTQLNLSAKFAELSRQLEQASFRDTSREKLTMPRQRLVSIESEGAHCRQLNEDWEQAINSVRILPGFEDFMRPKGINALRLSAVSGPIIILTTTKSACFALMVTSTNSVQYLKLSESILPRADLLAGLSRGLLNPAFDFDKFVATREHENHPEDWVELEARLLGGREGTKCNNPQRLWWCPTGLFSFLPLHAAGIYGNNITDCASDYVVSSYTPTITALLNPPVPATAPFKITAIIEPNAPGSSTLPGARAELNIIATKVPNGWLTTLVDTTVETARIHLPGSSIVHFACHGVQDLAHPLDSGLILTDGRLKVSDIMHRPEGDNALDVKRSMALAFLSACETAKGDQTIPDEVMHLAATLLFSGFRGVVATMWTMNDLDGPKIADTFYEHLFANYDPNSNPPVLPDLTQAAKSLHLAIAKLREEPDISFRRWVPFLRTQDPVILMPSYFMTYFFCHYIDIPDKLQVPPPHGSSGCTALLPTQFG
ncbi:CHAT domain-containing protein [Mycena capillaripes]|nr:CHAT domain-containing protein [Mycena capillaripes]